MENTPLEILVTNDDGYGSKGLRIISDFLSGYGNVTVLAPKEAQSGMSAALTLNRPLRLHHISRQQHPGRFPIETYALTGTPADCVKMAMNKFYPDKKPDLLVSGINHGSNASIASIYSGTLGATAEGTIYGVPSIGISLDSHDPDADFSAIVAYMDTILKNYFENPPAPEVFLNINFPDLPADRIRGIRFAAQGKGMWVKEFALYTDPHGQDYYWMTGEFLDKETAPTGDHKLLEQGYITIVPHTIDTTEYRELEKLRTTWNLEKPA